MDRSANQHSQTGPSTAYAPSPHPTAAVIMDPCRDPAATIFTFHLILIGSAGVSGPALLFSARITFDVLVLKVSELMDFFLLLPFPHRECGTISGLGRTMEKCKRKVQETEFYQKPES